MEHLQAKYCGMHHCMLFYIQRWIDEEKKKQKQKNNYSFTTLHFHNQMNQMHRNVSRCAMRTSTAEQRWVGDVQSQGGATQQLFLQHTDIMNCFKASPADKLWTSDDWQPSHVTAYNDSELTHRRYTHSSVATASSVLRAVITYPHTNTHMLLLTT